MEETLKQIKQKALEDHIPILMDETLEVIKKIILEEKPKRILEIGTAVGYSSICFAQELEKDAKIDTIEIDEDRVKEAQVNCKKMQLQNTINIILGNAIEILPSLNIKYDIIFIDAAKGQYPKFLKEAIRLLNKNGIILADNVLFKGYVLGDYNKHKQRTAVNNLRKYLQEIKENPMLESKLLEVGDGLAISRLIS